MLDLVLLQPTAWLQANVNREGYFYDGAFGGVA